MRISLSTLCYIEDGDRYLMLHRTKKEHDINKDKWIGLGGHFEDGESPEECVLREVFEESGIRLESCRFRGLVTFVSGDLTEYMHLFTADLPAHIEKLPDCPEGDLAWVRKDEVPALPIWEGDKIFLKLLAEDAPFFSLKLVYDDDGNLVRSVLDGKPV